MRRTLTKIAASIGLVIAFVVGGVALAARPAAAGPAATSCIGLDIATARIAYTSSTSSTSSTSLSPSAVEVADPTEYSINAIFPPDPDLDICGPILG